MGEILAGIDDSGPRGERRWLEYMVGGYQIATIEQEFGEAAELGVKTPLGFDGLSPRVVARVVSAAVRMALVMSSDPRYLEPVELETLQADANATARRAARVKGL